MKNRYDNMVEKNKQISKSKVEHALNEINRMLQEEEIIRISVLMKKTGLSRSFFYNNPVVSQRLSYAQDLQKGKNLVSKKQVIFDKTMEKQLSLMQRQHTSDQEEIKRLRKEVAALKKELNRLETMYISQL